MLPGVRKAKFDAQVSAVDNDFEPVSRREGSAPQPASTHAPGVASRARGAAAAVRQALSSWRRRSVAAWRAAQSQSAAMLGSRGAPNLALAERSAAGLPSGLNTTDTAMLLILLEESNVAADIAWMLSTGEGSSSGRPAQAVCRLPKRKPPIAPRRVVLLLCTLAAYIVMTMQVRKPSSWRTAPVLLRRQRRRSGKKHGRAGARVQSACSVAEQSTSTVAPA